MLGVSRGSFIGGLAWPTWPGSFRAGLRRVRPGVGTGRHAGLGLLRQVVTSLGRSKSVGLSRPILAKQGLALTQRSPKGRMRPLGPMGTRTQPLRPAGLSFVCASSSHFGVQPAAGPVNFHR